MRIAPISCLLVALCGGCILQDNPSFIDSAGISGTVGADDGDGVTTGGDGPTGGTSSAMTSTSGPSTSADSGTSGDMGSGDSGSTGDDTGGPAGIGCDDPESCRTIHVGPTADTCPHEVDGEATEACDEVGSFGLRVAAATLEFYGEGGLIVLHDNNGVATQYLGSIDLFANTTIRSAPGTPSDRITVYHYGDPGVVRLRGDAVHLTGFTIACRSGGQWGLRVREVLDTPGSETGGHLIENMIVWASHPEDVGSNSISSIFESLGPQTTVRNNHLWGYFEGDIDLRFAEGSLFTHNTVLWFQHVGSSDPAFDATDVDGLEISNNVFVSLTQSQPALITANDGTRGLVVVGNVVEGFDALIGGLEPTDPGLMLADNTLGLFEGEAPRAPLVLADSAHTASPMGTSTGTSLDGVELGSTVDLLPGAYQQRSALSLPRRTLVTVGEAMCGGSPCHFTKGFDNEVQRAVWSVWPPGTVEIYPSATPYAGPAVVSWATDVRGMGAQPGQVILRRQIEDSYLDSHGVWSGQSAVLTVTFNILTPTVVENLTVETGPDQVGITHEGSGSVPPSSPHEVRRIIVRDNGNLGGDTSDAAVWINSDVIVHDVLAHGGFETCFRFGVRSTPSSSTPTSTAWVHHVTCRMTLADGGATPIAAFEVASVDDAIIADAAVEMIQAGPLFRAQRRSSGDTDPLLALDEPISFLAQAISARGHGADFDGFSAADGTYTLVDVDVVLPADPFFVSALDSHLDPLAAAIDTGVDPSALLPILDLGVTVDGVDRAGLVPDRGCYEQGL